MTKIREWLESVSADDPVRTAIYVLIFWAIVVVLSSVLFYDGEFGKNILVEAHWMLFDLLVIGVFTFWLNRLGERKRDQKQRIERWQEEVSDYLGWDEKEAMFRIVGNIRRLNREGITRITLNSAYLVEANLINVHLDKADLYNANLSRALFHDTYLEGADLRKTNLRGCDMTRAHFDEKTNLTGAETDGHTQFPKGFDAEAAGVVSPWLLH